MARAVGANATVQYVLRDRERILDLFELLTGVRYSLNFLRFGGVSADMTEGFIERVLEVCEMIGIRLKEYNDLFTFNHVFLKRSQGVGFLSQEQALRLGVTGPNARASGVVTDVRKTHPYIGYERLDFVVPAETASRGHGDSHDRLVVRLREISQSLEILKQVCDAIPDGEFSLMGIDLDFAVPNGEAYARIESSRGLMSCHIVSEGKTRPNRVQFRGPSVAGIEAFSEMVTGAQLEDIPVILASLDLSISEVDR